MVLIFIKDVIHIYVDFFPFTETTSADEALALLISADTIFDLTFPKNNRTVRLLYSVLYGEKRFLTNTIRLFLHEKGIELGGTSLQKESIDSASAKNDLSLDAASSQTLAGEGKPTNESNASSGGNSKVDDVLNTTVISSITRASPMKSPHADNQ